MDTLTIWDEKLLEYGRLIIQERKNFMMELNEIIPSVHKKLTGQREELHLKYEPNVLAEEFGEKLLKSRDRDLQMKMTNVGPHRDDVSFILNDKDARKFGSQGQQRTAALSLKLSEIEIIKKHMEDNPVLLLDDVLSELDRNRQNYLLDGIEGIQTIITCTGLEEFIDRNMDAKSIYQVVDGSAKPIDHAVHGGRDGGINEH
jgi:DNA replication and repair protein RecF